MKRKYIIVLALCVALVLSLSLAACNTGNLAFEWDEYKAPAPAESTESLSLPTVPTSKAATPSIQIHYQRQKASEYGDYQLWLWTTSNSIGSNDADSSKPNQFGWAFNYKDDYGVVALYSFEELGSLQGGKGNYDVSEPIGLIVRTSSWGKDIDADRFWTLGDIDQNNYYHLYLKQGDAGLYNSPEEVQYGMSAVFTSDKQITVNTNTAIKHVAIYENDEVWAESDTDETKTVRYNLPDDKQPDLTKSYRAEVKFVAGDAVRSANISVIALYGTKTFNDAYYYDGELGAIYTQNQTEFKVWSPFSSKITLKIYAEGNGGEPEKTVDMTLGEKGVWSTTVTGDLARKYYTYTVTNDSFNQKEIVDPYAKSAGVNGLRGQIVNFAETNPEGWEDVTPIAYDRNELVVWETHVADVTSSTTWGGPANHAKKFLGLIDEGTTYEENGTTVKTGFDHIKELGVNAVQLVPIFDQANDEEHVEFNWGYNPLNYNVLEGAYATDASDGYVRINEFKQVVQAYNKAGINIIMDVVYNHVSALAGSNFDVLCPGYYFRYYANGDVSSGSGCGNDTASDHSMFGKFMIDSVKFWAKEYKLGGFRFDLMGLHDLDTMNKLTAELKTINPNIVVYGEPWDMKTATDAKLAIQANGDEFEGFGQFNDQIRDALIKGGMNSATSTGWVTTGAFNSGDFDKILNGMRGYVYTSKAIGDAARTVNYVTCHDNYTLYDRVFAAFPGSESTIKGFVEKMCVTANSVILSSNGISFMLAGEEFLRSKKELGATGEAIHNSYNASYKVNELDYARKIKYASVFETYQKLVEFKTSFKDWGLTASGVNENNYQVEKANDGAGIVVTIKTNENRTYKVIISNFDASNFTYNLEGYTLVLDSLKTENLTLSAQTPIVPFQTIIAYK